MSWTSMQNFLAMGGYGAYVWGSYAVAGLVLALEVLCLRTGGPDEDAE